MSATPNSANSGGGHVSNVWVDAQGKALQDELMIKLPSRSVN